MFYLKYTGVSNPIALPFTILHNPQRVWEMIYWILIVIAFWSNFRTRQENGRGLLNLIHRPDYKAYMQLTKKDWYWILFVLCWDKHYEKKFIWHFHELIKINWNYIYYAAPVFVVCCKHASICLDCTNATHCCKWQLKIIIHH